MKKSKIEERKILLNQIQTPDGTILISTFRHDYKEHIDKNGEIYFVDGGCEYLRRSSNKIPYTEQSIYEDTDFDYARTLLKWGTYGKHGKGPLKYVTVCEMSNDHILNILKTQQHKINPHLKELFWKEIEYREIHNINIKDK